MRNILHHAGIGADSFHFVAGLQASDVVLYADDGHGAEQAPAVQLYLVHTTHSLFSSWGQRRYLHLAGVAFRVAVFQFDFRIILALAVTGHDTRGFFDLLVGKIPVDEAQGPGWLVVLRLGYWLR